MGKQYSATAVVVEFGAMEVDAVILCIRMLLGATETNVEILHSGQDAEFDYAESDLGLEEAQAALVTGELSSILVVPVEESSGLHGMLFCPGFHGDKVSWWNGFVELATGYEADLIHRAKRIPGLDFVSVSLEDGLDFPDSDRVTEENFPWDDWRLIEAVVANGEPLSQKQIRRGPAAREVGTS